MTIEERSYEPITEEDLEKLKTLALKEHDDFFNRNPHLKLYFYDSLIGICLCQGAALHYLYPDKKIGVKDFDIWHFYKEKSEIYFPYRAHKAIINGHKSKSIDFLKRTIPQGIYDLSPKNPKQIIMNYLQEKNTNTKRLLMKKAVIGLHPKKIFGEAIWQGEAI